MSYIEDLNAITTPSLTDLLYIYQNGADFKITNQQLLDLIKTNTVIPITQSDYDDLTPAEKNNGSIYIITDASITAADVEYSSGVSVKDMLDTTTGSITPASGFTIRGTPVVKKFNNVVMLQFNINATTPFSSRQTIGNVALGFRPPATFAFPVAASDGINSFTNRQTSLLVAASGDLIVGDIVIPANTSIKEVVACVTYLV